MEKIFLTLVISLMLSINAYADLTVDADGKYTLIDFANTTSSVSAHTAGGSISAVSNDGLLGVSCNWSHYVKDAGDNIVQAAFSVEFEVNGIGRCINVKADGDDALPPVVGGYNVYATDRLVQISLKDGQFTVTETVYRGVKQTRYTFGGFSCIVDKSSPLAKRFETLGYGAMREGLVYKIHGFKRRFNLPMRCSRGFVSAESIYY